MIMKSKILGLLIAAGILSVVSCSQEEWVTATVPEEDGEEVTVTFSLSAEGGMVSTRAESQTLSHISDGTKATKLVYAVYTPEYNEDGTVENYRILKQYGAAEEADGIGVGQAVEENVTDLLSADGHKITLRLVRGKEYHIAFWAQSPECTAYDTKDLENIKVDYENAKNNDELRDAFSAAITFTAQPNKSEEVILTRVMAQINVGTSGWDYLGEVEYGNRYAYSKIEVTGVYNKLNALTGVVAREKENAVATFGWQKLPAYINMEDGLFPQLSTTDNVTLAQMLKQAEFLKTPKAKQPGEEFLYVKLTSESGDDADKYDEDYKGNKYLKYLEVVPTKDESNTTGIYTEVFKYLSMCYVLAPKHKINGAQDSFDEDGKFIGGTTVTVKFFMAEDANGNIYNNPEFDTNFDPKTSDLQQALEIEFNNRPLFTLTNVPVQGNWRTNILGGTGLDGKPNNPDEDTSIFNPRHVRCIIDVVPGYEGEHNGTTDGDKWKDTNTWESTEWDYSK